MGCRQCGRGGSGSGRKGSGMEGLLGRPWRARQSGLAAGARARRAASFVCVRRCAAGAAAAVRREFTRQRAHPPTIHDPPTPTGRQGTMADEAIHDAAKAGDLATLNRLLEEDASRLNAEYTAGFTPLIVATCRGHDAVVASLLWGLILNCAITMGARQRTLHGLLIVRRLWPYCSTPAPR